MPDVEWLGSALEEFLVIEAETASDVLKAADIADTRAGCRGPNPLKPDFTPERVDASWTKQPALAISRLADNSFEDDARVAQDLHPPRHFVDDPGNSLENSISTPTVRHHLRVKSHSTILVCVVTGGEDFLIGFHADDFAGLKIEPCRGCHVADRNEPASVGIRGPSPHRVQYVVQP